MFSQKHIQAATQLVDQSFIRIAQGSLSARSKILSHLLNDGRMLERGLDSLTIQSLLQELAIMDTNNFPQKVGVGEREGRVFSHVVQERHFHMSHGIGRSGDVSATQPKAAGSSILLKLTQRLAKSAIQEAGLKVEKVLFLPLATGMALLMTLLSFRKAKPKAEYVIWSRIDQKTCLKAILSAGLTPIIVEGVIEGDQICTNMEAIEQRIKELGTESILAICSTTSCFAPRVPDQVDKIAIIAAQHKLFHLVNNAYGIQCPSICAKLSKAFSQGEITAVVQSTDKNFMVPVGSSLVFCKDKKLLKEISETYPGRGSASGLVDLFITLLQMGRKGWNELLAKRVKIREFFAQRLAEFATKHGGRLLLTPHNTISMAITFPLENATRLGSLLYSRSVMGHRVVTQKQSSATFGFKFTNYGSHHECYPHLPYVTAAVGVGMEHDEVELFLARLEQSLQEFKKSEQKHF